MKAEIYISTDVEADGPIPGENSMLSFASVAMELDGTIVSTFRRNLKMLPGARQDLETMRWWHEQGPEVWHKNRVDAQDPANAMAEYALWLEDLIAKARSPVFVGYPASYDCMFVYWYLIKFVGRSPFGFQALDIKTLAMAALGTAFRKTIKQTMPREWFEGQPPHDHDPLNDAIGQGMLFCKIMAALKALRGEFLK